jgi:hypothetical protein
MFWGDARQPQGVILNSSNDDRSRKEIAQEKRDRVAAEGKSAMAEINARNAFIAKNTLRLRELRLAKEAADREAAANAPPPAPKPQKAAKPKGAAKKKK